MSEFRYLGVRITNDSKASAQLDYCNSLLVGTSVSNIWPAYSLFKIHLLGLLLKNLAFAALRLFLLICIGFLFITDYNFQDCYFRFQGIAYPTAILSCRPCPTVCAHAITAIFFFPCQYVLFHEKLQWQGPLPGTFGISYHVIFLPFPLSLLSGRNSSIIFFRVPSQVFPLHPLASCFVMSLHPRM